MKKFFSRFIPLIKIESVAKRRLVMIAMLPVLVAHPLLQNVRFGAMAVYHTVRFFFFNLWHHAKVFVAAWTHRKS